MCRLLPFALGLSALTIGVIAHQAVPVTCSAIPCPIVTSLTRVHGATAVVGRAATLEHLPRVQPGTLRWVGAFRPPPAHAVDGSRAAYGGMGLTYNPARNSLFMVGHDQQLLTAEFTIPTPSTDLSALPSSSYLQKYEDSTDGRRAAVNHNVIGGLLVYNRRLISTSRLDYDAPHVQNKILRKSHYVSGLDLSVSDDAQGPFQVGLMKANYVSGYMAHIPQIWQAMFGGMKALTGWCCGPSIIDRTSYGPAISAFNPDDLGVLDPVPTIPLLYYDSDHMTLGEWSSTKANPVYGMATEIHGVVFLDGTRSVLFVGRHGLGRPCYGRTTLDAALIGTVDANGVRYCAIGPDGPYGMHAAPYRYQVWAFDALDLVKVKAGILKPWQPRPYAVWELPVPTAGAGVAPRGVAYNQGTGQVFVYQRHGEDPYIHTYVYRPTP